MGSIACEDFEVTEKAYILRAKLHGGWAIEEGVVLSSNRDYVRVGWVENGELRNSNFYRYFGVNNENYLRECEEGFRKLFLTKQDAIEYSEHVARANKENEKRRNDMGEYNTAREGRQREREEGRRIDAEIAFKMLRRQRISTEGLESLKAEMEEMLDENGMEMSKKEVLVGVLLLQMAYELQERRQEDEEKG